MTTAADANPQFSWTDTLSIAVGSCTSCLPTACLRRVPSDDSLLQNQGRSHGNTNNANHPFNPAINHIPRARPDELQGLLADPGSPDTSDAERMSLHSNFGRNRPKRSGGRKGKGKKDGSSSSSSSNRKKITLFGFNLFGDRALGSKPPPIHLPNEDDALHGNDSSVYTDAETLDGEGEYEDGEGGEEEGVTGNAQEPRTKKSKKHGGGGEGGGQTDRIPVPTLITATTSSATFDSDAAPLSSAIIQELSSSTSAAALIASASASAAEFQRQKDEKEERRRRRRERKSQKELLASTQVGLERERLALERLKQQGVLPETGNGEEFEGFQGSGSAVRSVPTIGTLLSKARRSAGGTTTTGSSSSSRTGSGRRSSEQQFGPFVGATSPPPFTPSGLAARAEDDEDAADLGGEMYSGARRPYPGGAGGSNGSGDSRSKTGKSSPAMSASASATSQQQPKSPTLPLYHPNAPYHPSPLSDNYHYTPDHTSANPLDKPKKKSSSKRSSSRHGGSSTTTRSHRSNSTSQSTFSLASPSPLHSPSTSGFPVGAISEGNDHDDPPDSPSDFLHIVSPSTVEQGLGFFDVEDLLPPPPTPPSASAGFDTTTPSYNRRRSGSSAAISNSGSVGSAVRRADFPMAGFGIGGGGKKARDGAKFLANRGDD